MESESIKISLGANSKGRVGDVICLSHLRWDFVYQRPQHLLSRFAKEGRVFYFEEPIFHDGPTMLDIAEKEPRLFVIVPHVSKQDDDGRGAFEVQRRMLDRLIADEQIDDYVLWFYTPMAMNFADHLEPRVTVFDCMDELSAFKFAPPELLDNEQRLIEKADLIFTGGRSLYEAKKDRHERVYSFPSSIDVEHFVAARQPQEEPDDQAMIEGPKIGYCGVIDERLDYQLIEHLSIGHPEWQFVMIGPVVKVDPAELPRAANIHYLGARDYKELPRYLSGWDVAIMPFAMNESTKFISPTKTPEYLAAGLPVVSTPIRDVVTPYGDKHLVKIAVDSEEFGIAIAESLADEGDRDLLRNVDSHLSEMSWDKTYAQMEMLITEIYKSSTTGTKAATGSL